jgi:hypothetical protein
LSADPLPREADVDDWEAAPTERAAELATEDPSSVALRRMSDYPPVKVAWDDYPRRGSGILTLSEGRPDMGKSLELARAIADYTSAGRAVVVHADEDSYAMTWQPRLKAAGADLDLVFAVDVTKDRDGRVVPFYLSDDIRSLARKTKDVGAAAVFFDSLVGVMGSRHGRRVDSSNDLSVRQALRPLSDLGCSISGIRHHKKGRGVDATEAGGGSVAFFAVARVVLTYVPDPHVPGRMLQCMTKNNLVPAKDKTTRAYRIVSSEMDPVIPVLVWEGAVSTSADEALEALAKADAEKRSGAGADARAFLREALTAQDGVASAELEEKAKALGISRATMFRAKDALGIRARKMGTSWFWFLPIEGR